MASGEVLRIIGIYKMLDMHTRPSDIMGIEDAYTAFCFDEACSYIINQLKEGNKPVFKEGKDSNGDTKHYSNPSDFYKKFN